MLLILLNNKKIKLILESPDSAKCRFKTQICEWQNACWGNSLSMFFACHPFLSGFMEELNEIEVCKSRLVASLMSLEIQRL